MFHPAGILHLQYLALISAGPPRTKSQNRATRLFSVIFVFSVISLCYC